MSATGTVTITAQVSGGLLPTESETISLSNNAAAGIVETVNLTSTALQITVPSGARFAIIQGPSGNSTNLGVSSANTTYSNMLVIDPVNAAEIPLIASSPTLYMACASGTVSGVQIFFI